MVDLVAEALSQLLGREVKRDRIEPEPGRGLSWVETGDGPAILFVAGGGEPCLDWATLLPLLPAEYRLLAYDRAGSGASDPMRELSVDAEIDDLAALLTAVGPAILVGHSWGGLLVQLAARRAPELVRGLVLVDPTHERVSATLPRWVRAVEWLIGVRVMLLSRWGRFDKQATALGAQLASSATEDPETRKLLTDAYVAAYSRPHQVAMIRDEVRMADRATESLARLRAAAPLPPVPLLVLSAGAKPAVVRKLSQPAATEVADSVTGGAHRVVADSGHYIHHDDPEAVATAIAEVVAKGTPD